MTAGDRIRSDLIVFLGTIVRPGCRLDIIAGDDHLVDAGVLDSLAVIHIIMYLESEYGINLAEQGINPADILSINGILEAIASAP